MPPLDVRHRAPFALLFCSLFLPFSVQAQVDVAGDGFVVTSAGDTLRGHVEPSRRAQLREIRFQAVGASEAVSYRAAELAAVVLPELHTWHSRVADGFAPGRTVDGRPVPGYRVRDTLLLEAVVLGPARLYQVEGWRGQARFFLSKGGATLLPLHESSYPGTLVGALADCPDIAALQRGGRTSRARLRYKRDDLARFVLRYNRCVAPEAVATELRPAVANRLRFGLRFDLFHSDAWASPRYGAVGGELHPGFGGGLSLSYERTRPRFTTAWRLEALLARRRVHFYRSQYWTHSASMTSLDVPLLVRFLPGQGGKALRGFVEFGPYATFVLDQEDLRFFSFTAPPLGFQVGTGAVLGGRFEVSLRGSHSFFSRGRRGLFEEPTDKVFMRALALSFGYALR